MKLSQVDTVYDKDVLASQANAKNKTERRQVFNATLARHNSTDIGSIEREEPENGDWGYSVWKYG